MKLKYIYWKYLFLIIFIFIYFLKGLNYVFTVKGYYLFFILDLYQLFTVLEFAHALGETRTQKSEGIQSVINSHVALGRGYEKL